MLLRRLSLLAVLMLLIGPAVSTLAAPNPAQLPAAVAQQPPRTDRPGGNEERLFEQLNLSQEQKQKMQAIRNQYKDQLNQRRQALHQAQQELKTLMTGTASANQIREKHRQLLTLRQQLEEVQFESMLAMREVLTPEQRNQFAQLMQQRWDNFRNRGGSRGTPQPQ